jgi:hypothetical protein
MAPGVGSGRAEPLVERGVEELVEGLIVVAAGGLCLDLAEAIRRELGDAAEDPRVKAGVTDAMEGKRPRY